MHSRVDPEVRPPEAMAAFLSRWTPLMDGGLEPVVVVWADTQSVAYSNEAARAAFVDPGAAAAQALHGGAMRAVMEQGFWRGRDAALNAEVTALSVPGAHVGFEGGGVEGVALTWTPEAPIQRPLPGTLRRLVDLASDLLVGVDEAGRVVYRNSRARGFFPGEILGIRARDALQRASIEALRGATPAPEETVDASGARRFLLWSALPLSGQPGALPAVAVGRDVTDVTVTTARLGNRVQRLEAMHAISLALGRGEPTEGLHAMAFQRLSEVIPLVHGALYQLSGHGEGDEARLSGLYLWDRGVGRPLDEAMALSRHPASEALRQMAPTQHPTAGPAAVTWPQLRSLGRQGITAALAVPLLDEGRGFGVLWLGTSRTVGFSADDVEAASEVAGLLVNAMVRARLQDRIAGYTRELEARVEARTSELKSTQAQLLAAARLSSIGEMSAGVAHELNQPLNVIGGYVELLQEGDLGAEESEKALGVIASATDRMASLVRHLRDFSRAGVETLRGVDLRGVVDMARELTSRATKRPIRLVWERPDHAVTVLGDPGRLEQLFINLIANAMQATEANGGDRVIVRVVELGGDLAVDVVDQGGGVPEHLRARIFEPFFTTKDRGQGTGLGLSISAKIASEHQGRIEVLDGPGGGSVFRVVLPQYRRG